MLPWARVCLGELMMEGAYLLALSAASVAEQWRGRCSLLEQSKHTQDGGAVEMPEPQGTIREVCQEEESMRGKADNNVDGEALQLRDKYLLTLGAEQA